MLTGIEFKTSGEPTGIRNNESTLASAPHGLLRNIIHHDFCLVMIEEVRKGV
jgi:hypothetical protein